VSDLVQLDLLTDLLLAADEKAKKLEADKKGKYTDNLKCNLFDLAAELKKAEDQKAKLEQEKKSKYLNNSKYKFF
jgi:hypothetical protein